MDRKKFFAVLYSLAAGTLWGAMGIFVRSFTAYGFDSLQIAGLRIVSAAVMLPLFQVIIAPKNLKIHLRDLCWFALIGFCSILMLTVLYSASITLSSLSIAAILLYTAPIFVMIFSVILRREFVTVQKLVALILAFAGCIFVAGIGDASSLSTIGLLVGLGSGLTYASYSLFSTSLLKKYSSLTVTTYTFIMSAIFCLIICKPVETVQVIMQTENKLDLTCLIISGGIVTAVAPYILYTMGLEHIEAGKASILASVEPMVATLFGITVYHEPLTLLSFTGIVLILTAVILLNTGFLQKRITFRRKKA